MQREKLKQFANRHWLPLAGFLISSGIAFYFGFTFMADAIYFNDPRHKDTKLKAWMTPRYVTLSYDIPRSLVFDTLGLDQSAIGQGLRLESIAKEQNVTLEDLTERIRQAAEAYRESQRD